MHYAVDPDTVAEAATAHYIVQASGSTFRVKATATGMLSALGHSPTIALPEFEGEVFFHPDAIEKSSLRMVIRAEALTVMDDVSANDRQEINRKMHQEVLESDSNSEIVYECKSVSGSKSGDGQYRVALNGELTLRGIERTQAVSARVSVAGSTLRATGDFSIRQSDYDIRPVTALVVAIKLKDELKFAFDISARQQE